MHTNIIKIDPDNINETLVKEAAGVIKAGGLVAFPTETVYGLGANAFDEIAVRKIFSVKERPLDDPLIVHIAKKEDIEKVSTGVPERALEYINSFWPGPLTIILEKSKEIPNIVTSNLHTVAVRMPSNLIARKLIEMACVPIAAPSANKFGYVSPTSAQHVSADLNGKIDLIIDGGKSDIGIESTVIEFKENGVTVYRPGGLSMEDLSFLGKKPIVSGLFPEKIKKSPGKYTKHYAPRAKIIIIDDGPGQVNKVLAMARFIDSQKRTVAIIAKEAHGRSYDGFICKVLGREGDLRSCASKLFEVLRDLDTQNVDTIIAEGLKEEYLGYAIMDRLRKASGI